MDIKSIIDKYRPKLEGYEKIYRDIHQNPELSKQELRTSLIVASYFEWLDEFIVHKKVGGRGVVGVLSNGPGPIVLLRADMDALPHLEQTNLPYASTKVAINNDGTSTPVMHACGHDMHTTTLMAAAKLLQDAKSEWSEL